MTVIRYATIQDAMAINIILWDGVEPYSAPEDCVLVPAPDDVSIGWAWTGSEWVAPVEPEPEVPPQESEEITDAKLAAVTELMDLGISEATARSIVGLK